MVDGHGELLLVPSPKLSLGSPNSTLDSWGSLGESEVLFFPSDISCLGTGSIDLEPIP